LGEELILKKSGKFQPEKFKDAYTVALRELIAAKREKRAPKAIEEAAPASNVINLMEALKRSVRGDAGGAQNDRLTGGKKPAKAPARTSKATRSRPTKAASRRKHKAA
jgi:DNA end-binding protein Ku